MSIEKQKTKLAFYKLIFWKWTPNKAGRCPVYLHVEYSGNRKRYPVIHDGEKLFVAESDWSQDGQTITGRGDEKRKMRETIDRLKGQVSAAIDRATKGNRPFTWDKFESEFLLQESEKGFLSMFAGHLETLRREN